jgi:hypothetical protein
VIRAVLILVLVSVAPPPKETAADRFRRLWGEPVDPAQDCTLDGDGAILRIKIPGTPHKFTPNPGTTSGKAPRVRRVITGDFDARVKIISVTLPGMTSGGEQMTSGGIYVGPDDNTFITISRYATWGRNGPGLTPQFLSQLRSGDNASSDLKEQPAEAAGKPVFVRLVREGKKITTYTSLDGETWTVHVTRTVDWPAKASVGVFASHGVTHAVEGVFEDFKVTQPEK